MKTIEKLQEENAALLAQVEQLQQFCLTAVEVQELEAKAGRAGFVAGYLLCNDGSALIKHNYEGFADKYADKIRRGEVE